MIKKIKNIGNDTYVYAHNRGSKNMFFSNLCIPPYKLCT